MERWLSDTAGALAREHESRARFRPFAAARGITDLAAAYAVQGAFVDLIRRRSGAAPAGYKIGLTSARMQAMCGIEHPIAGVVLNDRIHRSAAVIRLAEYGHLGIEFEIGVRMGRGLPASEAPFSAAAVAQAVDAVCPAVELVDDRHAEYKDLDPLSLVADNSWNAGLVLGEFRASWPDLAEVVGTAALERETIGTGSGRDVMGHPFVPLAWLANHLAGSGAGLRRGDIVVTGSLVPTRFPAPGERYRFELSGLGTVEAAIEQ